MLVTGRIGAKDMTLFSKILEVFLIYPKPKAAENLICNLTEADIVTLTRYRRLQKLLAERDERDRSRYETYRYRSANPTSFDDWVNNNPETQGTYEGWADANPEIYNPTSDN